MARVRSRFSKKSKYYISKHVFLTAYHYCLNYDEWVEEHELSIGLRSGNGDDSGSSGSGGTSDPTASQAIRMANLYEKIETVRSLAYAAEPSLHPYLLQYVTHEDMTFDKLKAQGMPCERKMFYDRRRKFYWMLAKKLEL